MKAESKSTTPTIFPGMVLGCVKTDDGTQASSRGEAPAQHTTMNNTPIHTHSHTHTFTAGREAERRVSGIDREEAFDGLSVFSAATPARYEWKRKRKS